MIRRRVPILALLGVNVAVSVVATLLVLFIWESRREPEAVVLPTFSGVSAQTGGAAEEAPSGGENSGQAQATGNQPLPQGTGTSTPPATQGPEVVIHVVQPGEVMGAIAEFYSVPIEDILIANGLDDPNVLNVGQELIIPIGGLPPTPTPLPPTPVPTVALSPIATVTPVQPGTIDVAIEQVLSPGDVTREAVVIINNGAPLDMEGWVLSDEDGNEYTFPSFSLFGNGSAVTVYTGVGEDDADELYWGRSTAVWGEASDTAILRNPTGQVQSEFPIEQ